MIQGALVESLINNLSSRWRSVHFLGRNYHKTACTKAIPHRFRCGDFGQTSENGLTEFFIPISQSFKPGQDVPDPVKPGVTVELAL